MRCENETETDLNVIPCSKVDSDIWELREQSEN